MGKFLSRFGFYERKRCADFFFFNQGGGYDFPEAVVHCTALLGLDRIGLPEMGLLGPNSV